MSKKILLALVLGVIVIVMLGVTSFIGGYFGMIAGLMYVTHIDLGNGEFHHVFYAEIGGLAGLSGGLGTAILWCMLLIRRAYITDTKLLKKKGADFGMLAGIVCTLILHLFLMIDSQRWEWMNLAIALPVGSIAGWINGALWSRVLCKIIKPSQPVMPNADYWGSLSDMETNDDR